MPDVLIRGGAHVAIPDLAEIGAEIRAGIRDEISDEWHKRIRDEDAQARHNARAVKAIRISSNCKAGTIYLGGPNGVGPDSGYVWQVRLISCQLDASDTVQTYITSAAPQTGVTPQRLIQNWTTAGTGLVATFNAGACILFPDESLYLSAATHNITAYFVSGFEVPAEMVGRLI